jgi:hypothetical protein
VTPFRGVHAVELRDEAVRILRRAIEHTQAHNSYQALQVLRTEGVAWWEEAVLVPPVVLLGTDA